MAKEIFYGELTLVGTARVKKEIVVDLGITDVPAADNPDKETLVVGSGTNIETHTLAFNPSANPNDEEVFFEIHMPADVDGSVNVHFHLMWFPDPNWTTGNYKWDMEYIVKEEDGTRTTGSSTIITESVTPDNATDFIETEFSTTINADAQQVIYCRLSLDASESGADDDGHITFGEIEYTANKFGEAL